MKTAGKILGIILVLFLALMAAGVAYLIWIFEPNDYKPELAALVERHTGRRLHIDGDIHLTFFPDLSVKVVRIRLDDATGFGKGPFAELQSAAVRVKVTPLLSGQVVFERISLDGLRLHLVKTKNGKTNWNDLIQTIANTGRSEPAPDGTGAKKWVTGVPVLSLQLEDTHIIFVDRAASNRLEISDFDLSSGALGGGEPVAVQAEFQGKLRRPALEGTAEFSGQVVTDLDHRRYALGDTELTFKLTGPDLPPTGLQGKLAVAAEVDIPEGLATFSTLILEILPLRIEGEFMARGIAEAPVFEGRLAVVEFSPREVLAALGKPSPKTQDNTV